MMYTCPNCGKTNRSDAAPGTLADCQFCGAAIEVPYMAAKRSPSRPAPGPAPTPTGGGAVYFWLGFLLSVLGLIIAAIAGKGPGVRAAFKGFLVGAVLQFILGIIIGLLC